MADFLPRADTSFTDWTQSFLRYAEAHVEEMGFTAADLEDIQAASELWGSSFTDHMQAQANAEARRLAKDRARVALTGKVREFVGRVQSSPQVTNEQRVAMGLQVRDGHYHRPAGPPASHPLGNVAKAEHCMHTIRLVNQDNYATSKAKPRGVMGCEVWYSLDEPTLDPTKLRYAGTATRTPYTVRHSEEDIGRTAHYRVRWVDSRGQTGPWSNPFRAMVVG